MVKNRNQPKADPSVGAGLMIGNHGSKLAMSKATRQHLDIFWDLIDEVLNVMLFVLIGLEVVVLRLTGWHLLAGLAAVPLVLPARPSGPPPETSPSR